jgi:RNA 3'-terminal phosphate cyclase (ATP)
MTMISLDGAAGEGGGQVLRTALGLSVATGQPFAIENIRARRKNPGLQRQHLTAVLAAADIGQAVVDGTAGSTMLVLQTILPALWAAAGASTVELEGGTHNPMAPPFDFLALAFAPVVARMGAGLELELVRPGFHPAGGGVVRARVTPAVWRPLAIERSAVRPVVAARILHCGIPGHVAEREAEVLRARLHLPPERVLVDTRESTGPGNAVMVTLAGDPVTELVVSLGERGLSAEAVAERAVRAAKQQLAAAVPVGEHLADQLLIPMALAGGGTFVTAAPTEHTRTNAQVVERFLPVAIELRPDAGAWRVEVRPRR